MEIGFVGLGRMGSNMVRRLRRNGDHHVVAYDPDPRARDAVADTGAVTVASLEELVSTLRPPRTVWLMVPAGDPTAQTIDRLLELLQPDDLVVDGGNSRYTDSIAHGDRCRSKGVWFVDAGTSGGIWGLEVGYCLMVGGDPLPVARLQPALHTLAPPDGYLHVGPVGAGHFVKMVHNGIEYGMLQAYAEGFDLLQASRFHLDLPAIAHLWNQGSVIRSWLLELAERALARDPGLTHVRGYVEDSGEGRWTVEEAIDLRIPVPIIAHSLFARFDSRRDDSFANKVIAALRKEFGGHPVKEEGGTTSAPSPRAAPAQ